MGQRASLHLHPGSAGLQRSGAGTSWVRTGIGPSPVCITPLSQLQPQGHPSGTRHGHAQRASTDSCHAALLAVFCQISAGTLPPAARWLTRMLLCWQRKTNGKPRPIKVGELLRSAYAKRLVNQHQVILRSPAHAPAHAPVVHQLAWRLRGPLPLARHHRALGARAARRGRPGSCQHVWQR